MMRDLTSEAPVHAEHDGNGRVDEPGGIPNVHEIAVWRYVTRPTLLAEIASAP
jgi:hypothetical protein